MANGSLKGPKPQIAVIGAGVVGLSTAQCLLSTLPSAQVTVFADKFLHDTLSIGAGGFFRPEINIGPDKETIKTWARTGYEHYLDLAYSVEAHKCGMQHISGYYLTSGTKESAHNELIEELLPARDCGEREMSQFPSYLKYGSIFTSIVTDPRYYLPWLMDWIDVHGGQFIERHLESIDDLQGQYDIVMNCSGLGAKELVGDFMLTPIRGQVIKVRAPWVKHVYYADGAYIIPGVDYVTMGGIKEYGGHSTSLSDLDRNSIKKRCYDLVPSLRNAPVAFEWVGLRPFRQPVRVESELYGKNKSKVVHNYGHGPHGVTLSWGTAVHATQLAVKALGKGKEIKVKSKL